MTADLETWNTSTTEQRIPFGPRDNQNMPADWAADGLTWLFANKPQVFAEMMTAGILGIEKRAGRH